jgi:SAM-dependent methyltransferase
MCLRKAFPDIALTGVDTRLDLLACVKSRVAKVEIVQGDAQGLPLQDKSQDAVFCLHVVEHLPAPEVFFREAHRILRPGGILLMATPNAQGLGARIMGDRWIGYEDPTHICLRGPSVWRQMLKSNGFRVQRDGTTGLSGIPVFRSFPLCVLQRIPLFFCGCFPWRFGEAYMCIGERDSAV